MTHWFWLGVSVACILWYASVTVYVAIRGAGDIRQMITQLEILRRAGGDDSPGTDENS